MLLGCLGQEAQPETKKPNQMLLRIAPKIFYDFYIQKLKHTSLLELQVSTIADAQAYYLLRWSETQSLELKMMEQKDSVRRIQKIAPLRIYLSLAEYS